MKYVCKVCGYVHEGEGAIDTCPKCKQSNVFEAVNPLKGSKTEANLKEAFAGESYD